MNQQVKEPSGKGGSATAGKPPPYKPPPLANKGGEARWRQLEPKNKAFSGNERNSKWGPPYTLTQ